jgi:hypothetical protein
MDLNELAVDPTEPNEDRPRVRQTYFGRQGSPEVTIAFPFSKVEVTKADDAMRSALLATVRSLDALAEQVGELAGASSDKSRSRVESSVKKVRGELSELLTRLASPPDD